MSIFLLRELHKGGERSKRSKDTFYFFSPVQDLVSSKDCKFRKNTLPWH